MSLRKFLNNLIIFLVFFCPQINAEDFYYDYKILDVIDADTLRIEVDFLPKPLKPNLLLRIYGIDTPEKGNRAKCLDERNLSEEATFFVKKIISENKNNKIIIKKWDKYGGRVLGDVLIGNNLLSEILLDKKFAKPYFGEKKESWCQKR